MTAIETVSEVINKNGVAFARALADSETKTLLVPIEISEQSHGHGEYLPPEEQFSEKNAPTVVIVVRATPGAAEAVAALLARYRGDDPKAGTPKKKWFW